MVRSERRWLSIEDAAALTGLSPSTLRVYCHGHTDLVRGLDFYVARQYRHRARTFFTLRGIERLMLGNYSIRRASRNPEHAGFIRGLPPRYHGSSSLEAWCRLADTIVLVIHDYSYSPCAVPNCPCMVHRLGLPQADDPYFVQARAHREKTEANRAKRQRKRS